MSKPEGATAAAGKKRYGWWLLFAAFVLTAAVYGSGLSGGYLFDDYPNIVDNNSVQAADASVPSLVRAALSSPSSDFKRPLASLSFAANYLATGLDPYWMKVTNLLIHLLNGWLVFLLARMLLRTENGEKRAGILAALIAAGWMVLPINLTAVLYVVQRMESMANLCVLAGLLGYIAGRRRMLDAGDDSFSASKGRAGSRLLPPGTGGFVLCMASVTLPTLVGILAKETAVMLPLYALLVEWALFHLRRGLHAPAATGARRHDRRIVLLFLCVLVLPLIAGLSWMLRWLVEPASWGTRDFTLGTRLLSEARIVVDYIRWTVLPTPAALSFYHDDFSISKGLLTPWTTLASIVLLMALIALMFWLRKRRPLAALGIALFLGCQLLTGTVLPLELIYEHRNYFASFGLLLAIVPLLAAPGYMTRVEHDHPRNLGDPLVRVADEAREAGRLPMALPRYVLLGGLMVFWTALTAFTAFAWGNPLRLAEDLAARAPQSPRAQYELGRTYIIYSHYDPTSPFTKIAYAPLEKAAALPQSSILPEQALIFMNARMDLPLKDAWWQSMTAKLAAHKPTVQDESSLAALTKCVQEHHCDLPTSRMMAAFMAALSHPGPSSRLLANYGDYGWNELGDQALGERMTREAVKFDPGEPAYRITLIRMLAVQGRKAEAMDSLKALEGLNVGGRLDRTLTELRALPSLQ
ncbi:MAG: hypothetical protein ABI227_03025 [Rhodanobacter sp.]